MINLIVNAKSAAQFQICNTFSGLEGAIRHRTVVLPLNPQVEDGKIFMLRELEFYWYALKLNLKDEWVYCQVSQLFILNDRRKIANRQLRLLSCLIVKTHRSVRHIQDLERENSVPETKIGAVRIRNKRECLP